MNYPRPLPEYLVEHLNAKREARLAKRREAYAAKKRIEQIRQALRSEDASYGDISDLYELRQHISWNDAELLEASGIPEDVYKLYNTKLPKSIYSINVGNIGNVGEYTSKREAIREYLEWVEISKAPIGRAAGESVCLMRNGEPVCEHIKELDGEQ